jgi:hypothetical protein
MQEILQKAHQTSSRTAQVKTKKQEYAFGSSSPRELNLNEGTRAKQSSPRVESSRQQLSPSNIPLDKNKIRTRRVQPLVGGATSSSMTQSVMGTLPPAARISSSHVTSRMVQNMPKDRKDFKASNITKKLVASTNKTASNMAMVKSLYVPPSEKCILFLNKSIANYYILVKTKSAASKRTSIMLNQVHKPTLNTLNGSGSQIENPPRCV